MHKLFLFLSCLVILFFFGCSKHVQEEIVIIPAISSINIIDRNGFSETVSNPDRLQQYEGVDFLSNLPYEKVLRVYKRNQKGDIRAYVTSYHPNGQPRQYLEVLNNRAQGTYKEWHPNGALKLTGTVIGGEADITVAAEETWLFEGSCQVWNDSGALIADIFYKGGVLEGPSVYYHANGNIWKQTNYHQNKLIGDHLIYLENGQLLQTTHYVANEKEGPAFRYWSGEKIASNEVYQAGKLFTGRYYNACGELIAQVDEGAGYRAIFGHDSLCELQQYQEGEQAGEVKVFNPRGELESKYSIKNTLKNGEEVVYYPQLNSKSLLKPYISINWVGGAIQGLVKSWYLNGMQESQREMSENKKNGTLTAWYQDGSVMMIEEYDHDKLVQGRYFMIGENVPVSEVRAGKGVATIYDSEGHFLRKINYANHKPVEIG